MGIFLDLYRSLFPYLLFIPLGVFLNKKKIISGSWVTFPLIYLLMPFLVVHHVLEADLAKLKLLPVISFSLAAAMVLPALWTYRKLDSRENPHLIKSSFSFFNVAFFGIPTVTALFGEESVTVLICIYIGTALYGDIIGYYQVARSKHGRKAAFRKIFKVPFIYAFLVAIILKVRSTSLPDGMDEIANVVGIIVSAAGMLVIGMNASKIQFKELDASFLKNILGIRLLSAIVIMAVLLVIEHAFVKKLEEEDMKMLILIPFFPIAANVTVFASFLKSKEKESSVLILLSMAVSLLLIPLVAMWF